MAAGHAPVSPDLRADLLGIAREVLQEEAVLTAAHDITSTIRIQNSSTTDDTMSASRSSRKKASKSGGFSIAPPRTDGVTDTQPVIRLGMVGVPRFGNLRTRLPLGCYGKGGKAF
jgi:hypothetical protein